MTFFEWYKKNTLLLPLFFSFSFFKKKKKNKNFQPDSYPPPLSLFVSFLNHLFQTSISPSFAYFQICFFSSFVLIFSLYAANLKLRIVMRKMPLKVIHLKNYQASPSNLHLSLSLQKYVSWIFFPFGLFLLTISLCDKFENILVTKHLES